MDTKKRIDSMYTTFSFTCFGIFWERYKWLVVWLYFLIFAVFSVLGVLAIQVWNSILLTLFALLIIMGYDVETLLFFCMYISDSLAFICIMVVVVPCIVSVPLGTHIIKRFFIKSNSFGNNNPQYRIAVRHLQLQLRKVVNYKDPAQLAFLFNQLHYFKKTTRRLNEILNEFQKAKM